MKSLLLVLSIVGMGCSSTPSEKMNGGESMKTENKPAEVKPMKMETKSSPKMEKKAAAPEKKMEKPMAKKMANGDDQMTTCSFQENKRVIENRRTDRGGCEVVYTKNGEANTIATAINEVEYCQEVYDRVAKKLAAAGFNCEEN